ncbi:MAG: hypothetical protein RI924_920 [Bacteroidota bacterium]|jgi:hypothetical protein
MKKPASNHLSALTEGFDKLLVQLILEDLRQLRQEHEKSRKVYFRLPAPDQYFRQK